jgi:hypothetical protein
MQSSVPIRDLARRSSWTYRREAWHAPAQSRRVLQVDVGARTDETSSVDRTVHRAPVMAACQIFGHHRVKRLPSGVART